MCSSDLNSVKNDELKRVIDKASNVFHSNMVKILDIMNENKMNDKISNEKIPVEGGIELNDKDYINSILSTLKELVKNYAVSLTEASNEVLYSKYKTMFDEYSSIQREVYEVMFRFGWYELEKSETNKIDEKYNMLNQEFTKLS